MGSGTMYTLSVATPTLKISTSRAPAGTSTVFMEEPVSPTARLMDGIYIVVSIGLGTAVDVPLLRAGIEAQLARYPRFQSIQVRDKDGEPHWARTTVNVADHIVVPRLGPAADPDKAVEDYLAALPTLPMDHSRPAWEFHVLAVPTSEATATLAARVHHSFGDGMSLISLLIASTRSAADPARLPAMPPRPARQGAIYAHPRPAWSAGAPAFVAWVWSYFVLAWHTVLDVSSFVATILFWADPRTLFTGADDGGFRRTSFVHRSLSLDDVKFIKNAMNCTVNDVLVGVSSAALSRYYFRKSGATSTSLSLRSILFVNLRPTHALHTYVDMLDSGKNVSWGNRLGYIVLPFHIAMHDDPLDYVRKAKKTVDRKKRSLEVVFTNMIGETFLKVFGAKAGDFIFSRMLKHTSIIFSNVSGPTEKVQFCGHPVTFIAPGIYGVPKALNVYYQSYDGTVKVILSADEVVFPDCHKLLDDFTESIRLIKDATSRLSTTSKKNN